jgi:hypothetical protein
MHDLTEGFSLVAAATAVGVRLTAQARVMSLL